MTLEFEILEADYSKSLIESLKKYFWKTLLFYLLISFVIATFSTSKTESEQLNWTKFSWVFFISFLLLVIVYCLRIFYKTKKSIKKNQFFFGKKTILVEEDGFVYGVEKNKYEWNSVNRIDDLPNYIYLYLHNNTSILINKKGLNNAEINNFIGKFYNNLSKNNSNVQKQYSKNIYWLGLVGLIPNFGVIIGGILIFLGFKRKDNKLKLIGLADVLFTPLFWFVLMQFANNNGLFKNSNIEFTNYNLNEIVKDLEYYKSQKGNYPDSLGELKKQSKLFYPYENFNEIDIFEEQKSQMFYYKKLENDYILKSYGPDKTLNTKDDIYPEFKPNKH